MARAVTGVMTRRLRGACAFAAIISSCRPNPEAKRDDPPRVELSASPTRPSAAPPEATLGIAVASAHPTANAELSKTLRLDVYAPSGKSPSRAYAIQGAVMVVDGLRIGRALNARVEWVGAIPNSYPPLPAHSVDLVAGRFPDSVDVLWSSESARDPSPTYLALTGKGAEHAEMGQARFAGIARAGDSTVLGVVRYIDDFEIATVRGPKLERKPTTESAYGCTPEEIGKRRAGIRPRAAVTPTAFTASPNGALVAVGTACFSRGPAAEIWSTDGTSRIIDLRPLISKLDDRAAAVFPGKGDEVFLYSASTQPILRYSAGKFERLPSPTKQIHHAFGSPNGALYVSDGRSFYRFENGSFKSLGGLPWSVSRYTFFAADEQGQIWASLGRVRKLRDGGESLAFRDDCKTPFVFLYDVSTSNPLDFTFPATRAALASFPSVGEIELVEFEAEAERRLGVVVKTQEQGEALVSHVKANMGDEEPVLLCYAPKAARKIAIRASE